MRIGVRFSCWREAANENGLVVGEKILQMTVLPRRRRTTRGLSRCESCDSLKEINEARGQLESRVRAVEKNAKDQNKELHAASDTKLVNSGFEGSKQRVMPPHGGPKS